MGNEVTQQPTKTKPARPAGAPAAVDDTLQAALDAARLLGRWSLVAQRHGGGCSCCVGLGEITMEEVERNVLKALRERHSILQSRETLTAVLRDCVARRNDPNVPLDALRAMLKDLGEVLDDLERAQLGFF